LDSEISRSCDEDYVYGIAAKAYAITVGGHYGLPRQYSLVIHERAVRAADILHRQTAGARQGNQLGVACGCGVVIDGNVQIVSGQCAPNQQLPLMQRPESAEVIAIKAHEEAQ